MKLLKQIYRVKLDIPVDDLTWTMVFNHNNPTNWPYWVSFRAKGNNLDIKSRELGTNLQTIKRLIRLQLVQ